MKFEIKITWIWKTQSRYLGSITSNPVSPTCVLILGMLISSQFIYFQFLCVLRSRVEKREAEKMVKHVIKAAVKLGVLRRHSQLSPADDRALAAFRSKFHVSHFYIYLYLSLPTFWRINCIPLILCCTINNNALVFKFKTWGTITL